MSTNHSNNEPIRIEDNSTDQHVVQDVYDGVEEVEKPGLQASTADAAQPTHKVEPEERDDGVKGGKDEAVDATQPVDVSQPAERSQPSETTGESQPASKEKVDALAVMFPSIDREIITSVLASSSTQERAVETLLQMSDPTQAATTGPARPVSQMRQMHDDEALARRLQEMDFERNGRASSTPYDDLGYEPRRARRRERDEQERQRLHERADSLEPGFNLSDITGAFSELASTSKKHLDDFWSSMSEAFGGGNDNAQAQSSQQHDSQAPPPPRKVKIDNPYEHHYDPAIHRRAQQNNRQSMMQHGRSADFSNLGFLPRREIDLSQHKRTNSSANEGDEDDEYTHNPFNERK
ncbi:hypothetical protein E3P99_03746 [Wallemia hederae]|uniref:CUE domain-containing protein n=1 Tax=Wallemia hederae TaxID=1540922 RepID=A0A4T0FHP8_9BASI|nr:hypothetical protein E3P99_03746 [Wallemia hederae]